MAKFGSQTGFPHCSFCGKSRDQVQKLVAGPNAYICNECIELCTQIVGAGTGDPYSEDTEANERVPGWTVHSPRHPEAVELRTLQRQLVQISRQLANLADDMDGKDGS